MSNNRRNKWSDTDWKGTSHERTEDIPDEKPKPKPKPKLPSQAIIQEVEERGREGWGVAALQAFLGIPDDVFRRWEREHPDFFRAATYARTADIRSRLRTKQRKRAKGLAEKAEPVLQVIVKEHRH